MATGFLRSCFRWRLRTLMIFMALVAVVLGAWLRMGAPYLRQFEALQLMEENKAEVQFAAAKPAWLGLLIGEERFKNAVEYRAERYDLGDSEFTSINELPFLERLYISRSSVGDETARRISRLEKLRRLSLWRTRITNEGLEYISQCSKLRVLDIHDTCVNDEGLVALEQLRELRQLKLGGPVHGPGLRFVAKLPILARLDLSRTFVEYDDLALLAGSPVEYLRLSHQMPVSAVAHLQRLKRLKDFHSQIVGADDESVRNLCDCVWLEVVDVAGFEITDASVQALSRLRRLETLRVHGNLSDDSLRRIARMPNLKEVKLKGRFSLAAIKELAKSRPQLTGEVYTVIPINEYGAPRTTAGALTIAPLVHLMDYGRNRTFPSLPPGAGAQDVRADRLAARVYWPATLADAAALGEYPRKVENMDLIGPPQIGRLHPTPTWALEELEKFSNLVNLEVDRVRPEDLSQFAKTPRLQSLLIRDPRLTDEELDNLQLPDSLRRLIMTPSHVTPARLARLHQRRPNVEMRVNGQGRVHDGQRWQAPWTGQGSLYHVAKLRGLTAVDMDRLQDPLDLDPLADLTNLRRLDIGDYPHRVRPWRLTRELPRVRQLTLPTNTTDRHLDQLHLFPALETLFLNGSAVSDEVFVKLKSTPKLKQLYLRCNSYRGGRQYRGPWLTGAHLSALAACPELEELLLRGVLIRGRHLAGLVGHPKLRKLELANTLADDEGCEHLSKLPALQHLSLQRTAVTDAGLKHLGQNQSLRVLHIDQLGDGLTDEGLMHLVGASKLTDISLSGSAVTAAGVAKFKRLRPKVNVRH